MRDPLSSLWGSVLGPVEGFRCTLVGQSTRRSLFKLPPRSLEICIFHHSGQLAWAQSGKSVRAQLRAPDKRARLESSFELVARFVKPAENANKRCRPVEWESQLSFAL